MAAPKYKVLMVLYKGGDFAKEQPKLLGTVENALGIGEELRKQGHDVVITDDKEGPNSVFRREVVDSDVVITTPFHPAYISGEVIQTAKKLKICITAGVGSDHVDLKAASEKKIIVAEVTGSNVTSVAEHEVMSMLLLVRNYNPAHEQIEKGGWDVAEITRDAYDLENKVVGTLGAGRIGYRVLERLQNWGCKELLYYERHALSPEAEKKVGARHASSVEELLQQVDVLTINVPLYDSTVGMINESSLKLMKKGSWIVNCARGPICDRDAIAKALESGQLAGYAGDVWDVQPAPKDHVWRTMKNPHGGGNGMVPHYSGSTLDAQQRYASGTKDILLRFMKGEPQNPDNLICADGKIVSHSYGGGN